ncbi:MAG: DUF2505 domain-containing protein [Polyangiales bacterium]
MAVRMTLKHLFHTDPDTFWEKVFFDEEYNRRMYLEALGFRGFELLELTRHDDGRVTRKVKTTPKEEVPGALKKFIGSEIAYVESGSFDPAKKVWTYSISPSQLAEKVSIAGKYWLESRGPKQCERVCTVDLEVKVPFVGSVAEAFIEKQTRASYELAHGYTNKFLAEHGYDK